MQKSAGIVEKQRLLITMPWGIGDAIVVGLSAVDQITRNDPEGNATIDLLCNHVQTEILKEDPRIHCLIAIDKHLFPTNEAGTWKRGIFLSSEAVKLVTFLRNQNYTAVLPYMFAPTLFFRLHRPVMFLNMYEGLRVISRLRSFQATPTQMLIRWIIDKHFGSRLQGANLDSPIPLFICPEHIQKTRQEIMKIKRQAFCARC